MVPDAARYQKLVAAGVAAAVIGGLYLSRLYSYLLFHSLIEIATISIAFTLFILTWNTRKYLEGGYLKLIGTAYGLIALIDLVHMLSYKGMDIFPGYGANLPTQLWIAARYLQAATLFLAPFLVERRLGIPTISAAYAAIVALLLAAVFSGYFPDCYIEGEGLTTFKVASEYVISGVLCASLYVFYRKKKHFSRDVYHLLSASIILTILSELSFTAYIGVYDFANLTGHYFKLAAFYLIYRAIITVGIETPLELIFRDLKQAEDDLRESRDTLEQKVVERTAALQASEERYRSLIQKVQTAIIVHDGEGRILYSNRLAQELLGFSADHLTGRALTDPAWRFLAEDGSVMRVGDYPVSRVLASGRPLRDYAIGFRKTGREDVTWVLVNAEPEFGTAGEINRIIVSFVDITARKTAARDMARVASFPMLNPQPVMEVDLDGRVSFANPATRRLFPDLEQKGAAHPWLADWERLRAAFLEGAPLPDHREVRVNDHWYLQALYFVAEERRLRIYAFDITKTKAAMEKLRQSESKLREAQRIGHFGYWDRDLDAGTVTLSEEACRIFGVPPEEFGTMPLAEWHPHWLKLIHPEDQARIAQAFDDTLEGGSPYDVEYRVVRPGGEERIIHSYAKIEHGETGRPCRAIGTMLDVTEARKTEEALRRLNRELRAISECNQALMHAENEQSLLKEVCRIICEGAGYQFAWVGYPEEGEAKAIRCVASAGVEKGYLAEARLTWADTERGRGPSGTALRTGRPAGIANFAVTPEAAPWREAALARGYRSSVVFPLKDAAGETFGILNVYSKEAAAFTAEEARLLEELAGDLAFGITALRTRLARERAEDELRRYKDQLEETVEKRTAELNLARTAAEAANKAKSVFLANMSHELRTPLNAVLGFSSILRRDPALNEDQRQKLDIINRSGDHLLTLINDVLEVAKIEAGRMQTEVAPFDIGALVHEIADMMRVRANEKGLRLLLDQSSRFPRYVRGDQARLRQVLINLVGNAVKFTRTGRVTIRLGVKKDVPERLAIEIEDTGPGICPEDQKRLFQPFAQLGEGGVQKGTGLGLVLSRQYMQLMGGQISVRSSVGEGSVFRIELPLQRATEADIRGLMPPKQPREVTGLAPGQPTYRILIAEDQRDSQALLAGLMTAVGMDVRVAENGEECVRMFQEWHPHFIWMDRRMPVMDGIEAARRIRALPGSKDVKIVAVTASVFKEQRQEMLDAGMDDVVHKPYRFHEIYDCLATQLGVEYVYEAASAEAPQAAELTPEMFAVLSAGLRRELRDALESLDSDRIDAVIRQVSATDAALGRTLALLAENFEYPTILKALAADAQ